ncbi:SDR family oxidoreductase [Burkholderia multivorans]|uniref:SDR family NAD(P)-dependent oxidoreductase n=1 Tax=Burkholderia multivorans TaxID=87883 RepID=UPI000D008B3D|nr:SDR family oxidoreductase [Burkholderia multivorans]MBU9312531.1 SDR family oxidoreductase [Burkholderia multivorans]MCA8250705.1 SDR family oxidoreductase [Burkholderia multivorans]MCA8457340.1 SDR family oxidoreductase [Burkholderia multivorans]MDN7870378.1 SDR family oxidoreductase [Burkholderia multivorans]PRE10349.1 short-chain dehydrogenase [Burkholderia multivorans]
MSNEKAEGKLENKVAIVTGAGAGLGAACARALAQHGARVAVVDINGEAAAAVAADIGERAMGVRTDVSSEAEVEAMVNAVLERFGRIDILHNNAAVLDDAQRAGDRDVINMSVEVWDRAMAVNLRGAMLCCKHAIPAMLRGGGGSIIHSSSGFGAQGDFTMSAYAASKAGLAMLSKSVAAQYGKERIRSNTIQIGLVVADHPLPEDIKAVILDGHLTPYLGDPKHIADVVCFLASDEAAFITGDTIAVDGGFSSHAPTLAPLRALFAARGKAAY